MIIQALQELGTTDRDFEAVTTLAGERTQKITGVDGAVIELADADETLYAIASGTHTFHVDVRVKLTGGLSGLAVSTGHIQRCDDSEADSRVHPESCRRVGARSMILVRLRNHVQTLGVLKVISWGEVLNSDARVVSSFPHREVAVTGHASVGGCYV